MRRASAAALGLLVGAIIGASAPIERQSIVSSRANDALKDLAKLAQMWEPALFDAVRRASAWDASTGSVRFNTHDRSPCIDFMGKKHCGPAVYLIGGWQCGQKGLASIVAALPEGRSMSKRG